MAGSEALMAGTDFYNPPAFREDDPARLAALVDATVFGTLVSNGPDGPLVSHVPFLLDRAAGERGVLRCHLARVNDHWRRLDGTPVLAVFHGPDHYVTPSWYASKAESGRVVPTWNYVVVHVRGRAGVYQDAGRLRELVESLTGHMEQARPEPWHVSDAPGAFVERMLEQVVGVDVAVEHMEGKLKLGQNRPAGDRDSLAAGIRGERPGVWEALGPFIE